MIFALGISLLFAVSVYERLFNGKRSFDFNDWLILFGLTCTTASLARWGWDYMV